jgi:hypothetical protein
MKEEIWSLEGKMRKLESDKAGWQGAFIMLGFVVLLCAYSWATTPRPSRWDVSYGKPVVTLVTFPHWWSGAERTDSLGARQILEKKVGYSSTKTAMSVNTPTEC